MQPFIETPCHLTGGFFMPSFCVRILEFALELLESSLMNSSQVEVGFVVWIKFVLKSFLLPPGIFFSLVIFALILWICKKKWQSGILLALSFLGLYFLSTPRVAYFLMSPLEEKVVPFPKEFDAQAIVILGGGQRRAAPEYNGEDTAHSATLMRLAYGAYLYKKTELPILVSGGKVLDDNESEAKVMENTLQEIFSVPTKWKEELSQNTSENASYSSEILKSAGIKKILLVTEAWHMRRAMLAFSSTRLEVIPAPTNFLSPLRDDRVLVWLPNADSLSMSSRAMHEWIGYIWYRIVTP